MVKICLQAGVEQRHITRDGMTRLLACRDAARQQQMAQQTPQNTEEKKQRRISRTGRGRGRKRTPAKK